MGLTFEQRRALDHLGTGSDADPVIFDPTLGPLCVRPLAGLLKACPEDVVAYGRQRGWSDTTSERINGALALFWTLVASGVLPVDPFPDWPTPYMPRADSVSPDTEAPSPSPGSS